MKIRLTSEKVNLIIRVSRVFPGLERAFGVWQNSHEQQKE